MQYVTPVLLLFVFLTSLLNPINNDWDTAFTTFKAEGTWELDANSIIGKVMNKGYVANTEYFSDILESESEGMVVQIIQPPGKQKIVDIGEIKKYYRDKANRTRYLPENPAEAQLLTSFDSLTVTHTYTLPRNAEIMVNAGDPVYVKDIIAKGHFVNRIFYIDMSKLVLTLLFLFLMFLVYQAGIRSTKFNQQ